MLLKNNEVIGAAGVATSSMKPKMICELQKMYFPARNTGGGVRNRESNDAQMFRSAKDFGLKVI
jgi:hypothetical protein